MKIEEQFLTKSKFTKLIENVVAELRIPYMDAIIKVCETNEIELEDIKKFISPVIKNKLEAEAMELNYLPRKNAIDSSLFN
jgi:hypothetical protein|tara:strand:- start:856 stop:1098 length:243 start_codon:yes stop_codon:yes gene_type:complete